MVYDCIISWSYSLFLTTHMTFRTHLALTFPLVLGLSVGSVNKTTKLFADITIPLSTIDSYIRILANSADPDAHLISVYTVC